VAMCRRNQNRLKKLYALNDVQWGVAYQSTNFSAEIALGVEPLVISF
jgi:hypothetical protein